MTDLERLLYERNAKPYKDAGIARRDRMARATQKQWVKAGAHRMDPAEARTAGEAYAEGQPWPSVLVPYVGGLHGG